MLLGFVGVVELTSFQTIGEAQGKHLVLFGSKIDVHSLPPWLIAGALLAVGGFWLRFEIRAFARVWDNITADLKQQSL
jgi:branched-chain amino acid transport system permease protein